MTLTRRDLSERAVRVVEPGFARTVGVDLFGIREEQAEGRQQKDDEQPVDPDGDAGRAQLSVRSHND